MTDANETRKVSEKENSKTRAKNPVTRALGGRIQNRRGKVSQEAFARKIGVHKNTLIRYEKGERVPDALFLLGICERAKPCNPIWLLTGHGSMYLDEVKEEGIGYEATNSRGEPMVFSNHGVLYPRSGPPIYSEQIVDDLAFSSAWLQETLGVDPQSVAVVTIRDDAMSGTLRDGDMVLVNLDDYEVEDGSLYMVHMADGLTARHVQRLHDGSLRLTSDNPTYEAKTVGAENAEEVCIVGRIVWAARSF